MHHQVLRCSEQTTPANAPVNEAHMMLEIRHPNMRHNTHIVANFGTTDQRAVLLFCLALRVARANEEFLQGRCSQASTRQRRQVFVAFVNEKKKPSGRIGFC